MRPLRTASRPDFLALALALAASILAAAACRDVKVVLPEPDLALALPVRIEDLRAEKYGVWPFGIHGGGHPEGHGGFDFELDREATVSAAADGVVERAEENGAFPGQFDLAIRHEPSGLRTSYGHLASLAPGLVRGATVRRGDPLGRPAWRADEGFAMIHFAVTDERSEAPFGEVCPLDRLRKKDALSLEAYYAALPPERKSAHEPALCNERVLVSKTGDALVGSWFARRRPRGSAHPRLLTLTEFPRADGRRVYVSTEADGRAGSGGWVRRGNEIEFVEDRGGEGGDRSPLVRRFRLQDGVLVLGLGSRDEPASYDRRFRSVEASEGE